MQPLVSPVDHESRQGSHRAVDYEEEHTTEGTPLLRFPRPYNAARNPVTTAVVSVLLIILITGVIIGIYLLILQDKAENILPPVPPVDAPHRFVNQSDAKGNSALLSSTLFNPTKLIVVQTNTQPCNTTVACEHLLQDLKINDSSGGNSSLSYNFLVSSDGHRYTGLGWNSPSSLFPEYANTSLVLAFIGNFSTVSPTRAQLDTGNEFILESIGRLPLNTNLTVIGRKTKDLPKQLFLSLKDSPLWNSELSDNV